MNSKRAILTVVIFSSVVIIGGIYWLKQIQKRPVKAPAALPESLSASQFLSLQDKAKTPLEIGQYLKLVNQLATPTQEISLTNCQAQPLVAKVSQNQSITFKNNDVNMVKLFWDNSRTYLIEGGKSVLFIATDSARIYPFSCSLSNTFGNGSAGAVVITK